jgi:hypothetical protein
MKGKVVIVLLSLIPVGKTARPHRLIFSVRLPRRGMRATGRVLPMRMACS